MEIPTIYYQSGQSDRTFILLHGTGGDEKDLIPLALAIDPTANYLGIAGSVVQDGLRRYFLRYPDGSFDSEEVKLRVHELSETVQKAVLQYKLNPEHILYLGYSNGATTLAALMILYPNLRHPGLLFRPSLPFFIDHPPTGIFVPLLITTGENDPYTDGLQQSKLITLLEKSGCTVTTTITSPGHLLTDSDVATAKQWLIDVLPY